MGGLSRDELITQIYAAAVEPEGLGTIANLLSCYIDTDSAGVWMLDRGQITDITQTDDLIASIPPYLAYYARLDPWTASRKQPGFAYLGSDSVDDSKLIESEFYRDFARYYGMRRPMGLVLDLVGSQQVTIALNRIASTRLLQDSDRAVLQGLSLHLRGALTLRTRVCRQTETSTARAAALDAMTVGVVTCDSAGLIIDLNAAAEALGREDGFSPIERGRTLRATISGEDRALRKAIAAAAGGAQGAVRVTGANTAKVAVLVLPGPRSLTRTYQSRVLVYLSRENAQPGPDSTVLMRLFDLSPAQAALCMLLLAGRTFEEAAAERGIAVSTARSHFQAALERTGTRNLRDLLRMLSALPALR